MYMYHITIRLSIVTAYTYKPRDEIWPTVSGAAPAVQACGDAPTGLIALIDREVMRMKRRCGAPRQGPESTVHYVITNRHEQAVC